MNGLWKAARRITKISVGEDRVSILYRVTPNKTWAVAVNSEIVMKTSNAEMAMERYTMEIAKRLENW